jgi:hypothetical protein
MKTKDKGMFQCRLFHLVVSCGDWVGKYAQWEKNYKEEVSFGHAQVQKYCCTFTLRKSIKAKCSEIFNRGSLNF